MTTAQLGLTDWKFDPTVVLGLVVVSVLYVVAFRRGVIGDTDDTSPWFRSPRWRPWLFGAGVIGVLLALQSPIDVGGDLYLLSIHMVQHLMLMMIAPPLLLLGIAGVRPPRAGLQARLRAAWTWVTRPWAAMVLFNAVLLVWHIPQLYNTTLTNDPLHVVEHLTFIAVGVVFWWPIVDPVRGDSTVAVGSFQKIVMLVIGGIPPTILGFILAMANHPFYSFYEAAPRLWSLSPTGDQAAAGVIMLGAGNLIYFAAISVIFIRLFESAEDDEAEAAMAG